METNSRNPEIETNGGAGGECSAERSAAIGRLMRPQFRASMWHLALSGVREALADIGMAEIRCARYCAIVKVLGNL